MIKAANFEITTELVALRAYEIYLNAGCPEGQAEEHWLRAEAELKGACQPTEQALLKKPMIQGLDTLETAQTASPLAKKKVSKTKENIATQ